MIEPILRRGMESLSMKLQVHPKLERFRARVPYFLVTGLITCLLMLPAISILGLAQFLGYRGTAEISLTRSWLTMLALPFIVMAALAAMTAVGRLSGYRPFIHRWTGLQHAEARELSNRIKAAAEAQGFMLAWRAASDIGVGDFVATLNIALENNMAFNSGMRFPIRLSFFATPTTPGHFDACLKLANRTVVIWDTGERATCRQIGQAILNTQVNLDADHELGTIAGE